MPAMKKQDVVLVLLVTVSIMVFGAVGWLWWGEAALLVALALSTMCSLALALEIYRRLSRYVLGAIEESNDSQTDTIIRQTEALLSLFSVLRPSLPLPDTRGSAMSPDLLKRVVENIYAGRPSLVLEAGSGASTLFIAYCLRQVGQGRLIALEHDTVYLESTRELLALHGVEDFATVVHAPLREVEVRGQRWLWYDTTRFSLDQPIDLLVIDGPPGTIGPLARYPALPLLFEHLDHGATIIVDDANRPDERKVVTRWRQEYRERITCDFVALEKGAYILRKVSAIRNVSAAVVTLGISISGATTSKMHEAMATALPIIA